MCSLSIFAQALLSERGTKMHFFFLTSLVCKICSIIMLNNYINDVKSNLEEKYQLEPESEPSRPYKKPPPLPRRSYKKPPPLPPGFRPVEEDIPLVYPIPDIRYNAGKGWKRAKLD